MPPDNLPSDLFWAFALVWIRDELRLQGISQAELARRLHRSETAVSRWFSGEHQSPGSTPIAQIIEALGADPIPTYRKILKLWEDDPTGKTLQGALRQRPKPKPPSP